MIFKKQNPDGSFHLQKSKNKIFATSCYLILNNQQNNSTKNALKWLKKQKNKQWLFDENLGTNFLALSAILERDPEFIHGKALGKILTLLTFLESNEGGPYYSKRAQKSELELDNNIAIAYFLHLMEIKLPNLNKLIEKHIEKKDFSSKTFDNDLFWVYLLSKFYKGNYNKKLISYLKKQSHVENSELVQRSLKNLSVNSSKKSKSKPKLNKEEKEMLTLILEEAEKRFSHLPQDIKFFAKREIERTILGNPDKQMFLMPFYIKQALGKKGETFSKQFVAEMGLANTFYWTAFIIYDDFWDEDEAANPQILPTANLYARHYCDFFSNLLPCKTGFRGWFHELMDKLDAANTWETISCRTKVKKNIFQIPKKIPNYGNYELKYEPASGHILSPVAMFCFLGKKIDSPEVNYLIDYFRNYLIAMQINDDAHDWKEDMQRGHLSTVVVMMLEDWLQENPDSNRIDLIKDEQKLEEIYWYKTIKRACETALQYTERSRAALNKITSIENVAPLEKMIKLNEKVALDAIKEQRKSIVFLKEFN